MSYLSLRKISKNFGETPIVRQFDLEIAQGSFVTFLGPSGSGKTTMLNMIAGYLEPSDGTIFLDGRDVTSLPPKKRNMGMVFQAYALFPHMTVAENVAFGLGVRKVPRAERNARVVEMLEKVGLGHLQARLPRELSGGQQQRVALARALVIQPDVLLLDEPFSNLDAKLRQDLREEVRRLQQQIGITTIFVTHDQEEAMAVSDQVVVMDRGVIQQAAAPQDLYCYPENEIVARFLGDANVMPATCSGQAGQGIAQLQVAGAAMQAVARDPQAAGGKVDLCIRPERISLRDADAASGVDAEVVEAVYLGAQWRYQVKTAVGTFLVKEGANTAAARAVGARCKMDWAAADAWVLPSVGGK